MKKDIERIAEHFGRNNQQAKAIEECSELIQAISKIQIEGITPSRYTNMVEEIADVEIMISQLKHLYVIGEERIDEIKRQKIQRTIERYEIDA